MRQQMTSLHLHITVPEPKVFRVVCCICGQEQTTVLGPEGMPVQELAQQLTYFHRAHLACELLDQCRLEVAQ